MRAGELWRGRGGAAPDGTKVLGVPLLDPRWRSAAAPTPDKICVTSSDGSLTHGGGVSTLAVYIILLVARGCIFHSDFLFPGPL